jgi:nucleoside-diphosphate-sugar epimerase
VTGAAGFIGSHLCRRLVAEGHEVIGLDDLSEGDADKNLADVPEVRLVAADLLDAEAVVEAATGCDVVLHQAARKSVPRSVREPDAFVEVNVRGTLHVLLAARDVGASVVSASSSSVYGDQEVMPLREDLDPRPMSPYAATKLAGEALARSWWHSYGVPTVSLRYFNVYGPYQDPRSEYAAVVPRFATACLSGGTPVVYGDGEQARDFTFIDDVVEANLLAARAPEGARGTVLNVGAGREPTTVNRLLELVGAAAGRSPEPRFEPGREGDIRRSHADVSRATALLGYEPMVAIDEGVRRTVQWFAARER